MFTVHGQHFFVDILCCHIFFPQKPHNTTLFYCGTRIQGRRHLVTAAPSLQSCAYRSLRVTIQKRGSQLGFVTYLLTYLRTLQSEQVSSQILGVLNGGVSVSFVDNFYNGLYVLVVTSTPLCPHNFVTCLT